MAQTLILMTLSGIEFVFRTNKWVIKCILFLWTGMVALDLAFILPLIAMLTKEPENEMLQPDAFCEHTMQQNETTAEAAPGPPRGAYSPYRDGVGGEGKGRRAER